MGKEASFEVEVVENPIESVVAHDISIPAYTGGYYADGYDSNTEQWQEYYRYSYQPKFTVTYKNGDVKENVSSLAIEGQTFSPSYMDDQSLENSWKEGIHEVTGTFLGKEFSFNVEITKSPFVSLEVLKVNPVIENANCRFDENGNAIYDIPTFSFKAVCEDGTVEYGIYDSKEELGVWSKLGFNIVDAQSEKPWKVGSDNSFKIEAVGLEVEVPVEVRATSKYTYVEQNGGIYITSCQDASETIEIPSEIDGKPVIGIVSLGDALTWATKLVIPDSVQSIGAEAFQCYPSNLETLEIGSGVNYLDADMFSWNWSLSKITISKDNPYYCAVDNVVYDKNMTKVVVYPLGRGYEYTVPATVTDIGAVINSGYGMVDITFEEGSTAYVTEDGITYTADKKKVIYCNPSKTGSYEMPNSVTEIGEMAFWESSLKEIKISNKVTEIAYGAFYMSSLENVQLPEGLKTIDEKAFGNCENLTNVNFPEGLEYIGQAAFNSTSIKQLVIPDSVKKVDSSAFSYAEVQELTLGKNLKEIGTNAFYHLEIEDLVIPDSVTHIGKNAFGNNQKLAKVVVGKGVQHIEESVFENCEKLKEVVLKNENVSLDNGAFWGCPIETINIENVKGKIGEYALSGAKMEEVTFAEGVTRIAYSAMIGNENLETIDLPDSLESLGGYAFDWTPWEEAQEEGPVYLEQVFYKYKGEMPENTEFVVKEGTTILADYALEHQGGLKSVTLPKGLKTIGRAAFYNASNLKEITIPSTVSNIGESAFFGCDSLENITVDSASEYFSSADGVLFSKDGTELIWCPKRAGDTYEVPSTVKVIKKGAFAASGVENVVIRNNDIKLEEYSIGCAYVTQEETKEWETKGAYQGIKIHCFEGSTAEAYAEANFLPTNVMEYKPITKVELSATSLAMKVGETATLNATISPADTTIDTTLTWSSSNSNVVSCENGVLKALKIGSATITVKTSNGKTATCVVAVSGEAKWEKDQNGWWFVREDGSYPTNQWYEIGGEWYYFNASGYRAENQWVGAYYVNGDGVMVKNQWVGAYYVGADGRYISSAQWLQLDGKWYYLNQGGTKATGWQAIGGAWYYFDAKGVMATGEETIGGTEYYFLSSGTMATGWQMIDSDWYYYAGSGAKCTDWQAIGGTWYYFDTEGVMTTGEKKIGGTEYYFLSSGAMATGWQAIDGDWYYYAGSGAKCTDWQAIGGIWYYFNTEGVMITGKKTIGGAEYYFLASGAMATGWQVIGGDWYYLAGSGAMVKSQWVGNYYMLENGVMATNQWIGNYYVGADGAWQPNATK